MTLMIDCRAQEASHDIGQKKRQDRIMGDVFETKI